MDALLSIQDLAERWGVSVREARRAVVEGGLPRIELRDGSYISWTTTRFSLADVAAWEEGRKRAGGPATVAAPAPVARPRITSRHFAL